ncbi:MAG: thiamine pyrophosphate-dependent dehydrogenase E1 component subunit alpha [Alicyclobacillus sp.]|nr:thiamine pyrophosphate-dependent dehydrogenase E1 component subunit alpha [Alicyclobacillus sp.]
MAEVVSATPDVRAYSKEFLLGLYRTMVKERVFDENLCRLLQEGKVGGFYHSGQGQEAIAAGSCAALRKDDYIFYDHRGCNQKVAKGVPLSKLYGDFLGTVEGTTKGLGAGIVHSAWPELGVLGQSGTIGASFNIAVGTAMSAKKQGQDRVTVCYFGDGTSGRETFHGAMNWAGIYRLPVIFLLENNEFAISSHFRDMHAVKQHIADRADGYGIPGYVIDGNDPLLVYEVTKQAVERARSGQGPTFIEARTWRLRGHYEGDPVTYIDKAVMEEKRKADPIPRFRTRLTEEAGISPDELAAIDQEVLDEVLEAIRIAEAAPLPHPSRIYEGLFA